MLPPPFGSVCIWPGEEDGLLDEVEETEVVVVVGVSSWVEDWGARGQNGEHGKGEFVYSLWNQSEWLYPLSSIFLRATRMPRRVVKESVKRREEKERNIWRNIRGSCEKTRQGGAVVGLWSEAPGRITLTVRVTAGECKKKNEL